MSLRKKLIEVALPLEAINREAAREKMVRHGHPSTLHLWWARRPLAACRAVLFASVVDDPASNTDQFPTEETQEAERQRLFRLIEELVLWDNSTDQRVLDAARKEIQKATGGRLPRVLDPFCGGGSIPFEAQRLGLETDASDLNPVAVLVTGALVKIPTRFEGKPPVNPKDRAQIASGRHWEAAAGLAADVKYYGAWMRAEAERRIGSLYPKVRLPKEMGGSEARVIAWIWARDILCPNPACRARMPLVSSFWLSSKRGNETWVRPIVDRTAKTVRFDIRVGAGGPPESPKLGRGAKFRCLVCGQVADEDSLRHEFQSKTQGRQLMAIIAEGPGGRVYLPPDEGHVAIAESAKPNWRPTEEMNQHTSTLVSGRGYGITHWRELFTERQLVALSTFSDLVGEARKRVLSDASASGVPGKALSLNDGGTGAEAYADAIATYLSFGVDKMADTNSTLCTWQMDPPRLRATFGRQALPMTWDYAEAGIFSDAAGDYQRCIGSICEVLQALPASSVDSRVRQLDAASLADLQGKWLISTDPPYYDNIGYADLSDFFYIWLRHMLGSIYPDLFSTVLVPKTQEMVAAADRFGGSKEKAARFFEAGLGRAFAHMRDCQNPEFPLSVYYAFKQAETSDDGNGHEALVSTGWETMLDGLLNAGFMVTGTWPMRSEMSSRNIGRGTNALASSIVLVCRPRDVNAPITTRRDFLAALRRELPVALRNLQRGNVAPVDLAQASIGPGIAVFSRYSRVLEADGSTMRVRTALSLINQALDEVLAEQESEYDPDTRWAVAWFDQYGTGEGPYGVAETLSKAKNTSVSGLVEAGLLHARAGKVRLLRRDEFRNDWDPGSDSRLTVWEATQYLIRSLETDGEGGAARLARTIGPLAEVGRDLAYRLYTSSERRGWAQDAVAYNSLVVAWPEISRLASKTVEPTQSTYL